MASRQSSSCTQNQLPVLICPTQVHLLNTEDKRSEGQARSIQIPTQTCKTNARWHKKTGSQVFHLDSLSSVGVTALRMLEAASQHGGLEPTIPISTTWRPRSALFTLRFKLGTGGCFHEQLPPRPPGVRPLHFCFAPQISESIPAWRTSSSQTECWACTRSLGNLTLRRKLGQLMDPMDIRRKLQEFRRNLHQMMVENWDIHHDLPSPPH